MTEKKKFAKVVKAWSEGEKIEYNRGEGWKSCNIPVFFKGTEFRVKSEEIKEIKPHIHCDVIKAWAEGEEIEYFNTISGKWVKTNHPNWINTFRYRIKPKVLEFDWSVLPCNADYAIAMTARGCWIAFDRPKLIPWSSTFSPYSYNEAISREFYPKNFKGDWKESLHINPKYE